MVLLLFIRDYLSGQLHKKNIPFFMDLKPLPRMTKLFFFAHYIKQAVVAFDIALFLPNHLSGAGLLCTVKNLSTDLFLGRV